MEENERGVICTVPPSCMARYNEEQVRKLLGDRLPSNYRHKPNTVIFITTKDELMFADNGDGTVSGMEVKQFAR
jgi:hypothetical protein